MGTATDLPSNAPESPTPERRPIAARNRRWAIAGAAWLAGRGVSPNAISLAGMAAGLLAGACFAATQLVRPSWPLFLAAAALMQVRLLANMFDGMVAINRNQASPLGQLFNEVPDRVSDVAICVGAGFAVGATSDLGYLAAIAALVTAYVRAAATVAGAPQDFSGWMAKQQRMAVLTAAALYSALAPTAWQPRLAWPIEISTMGVALGIVVLGASITSLGRLQRASCALSKEPS